MPLLGASGGFSEQPRPWPGLGCPPRVSIHIITVAIKRPTIAGKSEGGVHRFFRLRALFYSNLFGLYHYLRQEFIDVARFVGIAFQ